MGACVRVRARVRVFYIVCCCCSVVVVGGGGDNSSSSISTITIYYSYYNQGLSSTLDANHNDIICMMAS